MREAVDRATEFELALRRERVGQITSARVTRARESKRQKSKDQKSSRIRRKSGAEEVRLNTRETTSETAQMEARY